MLALFGGTGGLPGVIAAELVGQGRSFVVCEMRGFPVEGVGTERKIGYRLEHLGSLLAELRGRGVSEVCFAGAVRRPEIDPAEIDAQTLPLIPTLQEAMGHGDDGALRGIIAMFEAQGFHVTAAHELVPSLLPPEGVLAGAGPDAAVERDLAAAMARHSEMSRKDSGQAVIALDGRIVASEGPEGTDAMLAAVSGAQKGLLYKAPKLGQDRRADLPVIGPGTIEGAARCGIATVVIEAGGVMVLERAETERLAALNGICLWVRKAGP